MVKSSRNIPIEETKIMALKYLLAGFIFSSIIFMAIGLPLFIQSIDNNQCEEPEQPIDETFTLTISFENFYVMNNDTLEKNYSYYLHSFELNGLRLRDSEWQPIKDMNITQWMIYVQNNIYLMEEVVFGIVDSSLNKSLSIDNLEIITNHTFVTIFSDLYMTIYNNDTTTFNSNVGFSWILYEFMPTALTWNEYTYKSTSATENIDINIKGCSYNYTSNTFHSLYVDFNGIEKEVLAL